MKKKNSVWKYYHVFIEGRNFRMRFEIEHKMKQKGYYMLKMTNLKKEEKYKIKRMGFYVNVYVRARNMNEAEFSAMRVIRRDSDLRKSICNAKGDSPVLNTEEINQLKSFSGVKIPRSGLALFTDYSKKVAS